MYINDSHSFTDGVYKTSTHATLPSDESYRRCYDEMQNSTDRLASVLMEMESHGLVLARIERARYEAFLDEEWLKSTERRQIIRENGNQYIIAAGEYYPIFAHNENIKIPQHFRKHYYKVRLAHGLTHNSYKYKLSAAKNDAIHVADQTLKTRTLQAEEDQARLYLLLDEFTPTYHATVTAQ